MTARILIDAARELSAAVDALPFAPPVTHVYNPLDYAWEVHRSYLERYGDGRRRVVIVRAEGERMGLVVDDILGQHQTVIKPMSAYHADLDDFAGATILADGTVALILDVAMLLRRLGGTGISLAA